MPQRSKNFENHILLTCTSKNYYTVGSPPQLDGFVSAIQPAASSSNYQHNGSRIALSAPSNLQPRVRISLINSRYIRMRRNYSKQTQFILEPKQKLAAVCQATNNRQMVGQWLWISLAERLLLIPAVHSSNTVIGKIL